MQGAFISDNEISDVVTFLKENEDVAVYDTEVTEKIENKLTVSYTHLTLPTTSRV